MVGLRDCTLGWWGMGKCRDEDGEEPGVGKVGRWRLAGRLGRTDRR